jgi:sn-glycerol 3-phosphate transport system ATP-binding protein
VNFGGLAARRDLEDGTPAILGVRPEHIHLAEGGVPGKVEAVTLYLAERYQLVEVKANGEHWLMTVPLEQRLERGMAISCAVDPEAALLFDPKTELRIG